MGRLYRLPTGNARTDPVVIVPAGGAALGYDDNGNLTRDGTWTYTYDADNRLKTANKVGVSASFAYDAEGRMRQTTVNGVITDLLYDGTDLVAEYDGAGNLLRRYVHGPGTDEPLVWYEGAGTTAKTWLYADHQGSIVATANSTGAATALYGYDPYGNPDQTAGVRFRYTGQQWFGDLGLYYYKARFYSPKLGRFLQTDPIGYRDNLNLYAYVGNNPVNFADSKGMAKSAITSAINAITPGSSAFQQSYLNYQAGNYGNSAIWGLQGVAEFAAAGVTDGAYRGAQGVVANTTGRTVLADEVVLANRQAVQDLGIPTNLSSRQSLHINPGDGRSPLTVDPQELLNGLHAGDYSILRQTRPNSVVVDFGNPIGEFWQNGAAVGPTQYGTVHFGSKGTHIVPANPTQW